MDFTTTTSTEDIERVRVTATIADAEIRPVPYTRSGRRWRPTNIRITWGRTRENGGDWTQWGSSGASVSGPVVRKDNSDGANTHSDLYLRERDAEFGAWIAASKPKDES